MPSFLRTLLPLTCLLGAAACNEPGTTSADLAGVDAALGPSPLIVERPYTLLEPAGYDPSKPAPLLLALHGYGDGDDGQKLEKWVKLTTPASDRGFLYALPDATPDGSGQRAWNGTDACCDFDGRGVDDVSYLAALIDDVGRTHNLDRKRVYVMGISAGGVMAHRLACDLADRVAAIVSISGATWYDASRCNPSEAVAVVEFHGDNDQVVPYGGGVLQGTDVPSAHDTVAHWAMYNVCPGGLQQKGPLLDLEVSAPGAETRVEAYNGCVRGDVELWTAMGGPHASYFTDQFAPTLFDYFLAHPKH